MNLKNKGSKVHDVPSVLIKENKDIFSVQLSICYNNSLDESIYPDVLKVGRITPAYKSGPKEVIDNYRPISALPTVTPLACLRNSLYLWPALPLRLHSQLFR